MSVLAVSETFQSVGASLCQGDNVACLEIKAGRTVLCFVGVHGACCWYNYVPYVPP